MQKLYFHHLDIYSKIYTKNNKIILSPYLCDPVEDKEVIKKIIKKSKNGKTYDFEYSTDLVLTDMSLLNELKSENCYCVFSLSSISYKNQYELFLMKNGIKV